MPSRRHNLQTGPVYLAILFAYSVRLILKFLCVSLQSTTLHATLLAGTATIVGQRGDVFDRLHSQACRFERGDRAFASTAGALHFDLDILNSKFLGFVGSLLSGALTGERGALATSLEATGTRTGPAERIAFGVGDGDRGVVEGALNMSNRHRHIPTNGLLLNFWCFSLLGHFKPLSQQ